MSVSIDDNGRIATVTDANGRRIDFGRSLMYNRFNVRQNTSLIANIDDADMDTLMHWVIQKRRNRSEGRG